MDKCILCYPRVETGLPPVCFHSCVGKIRSFGVLLYDRDRLDEVMLADEKQLVATPRSIVLDPFDETVIEAARKEGISDDWIDAAQRSPVYKLFKKWELALPLHPEFRTLPSLFYIMPQSPITTSAGDSSPDEHDVFDMTSPGEGGPIIDPDALDKFRLPLQYLANMFAAGDEAEVRKSLRRQLAVRHYGRSLRVEKSPNLEVLEK